MKFFEMLSDFFMTPVDSIVEWINGLGEALGMAWNTFLHNAMVGTAKFVVNGIAVVVISYMIYCACRVMISNKDEKFSEYMNKSLIGMLAYFFAKCGGVMIINYIGG